MKKLSTPRVHLSILAAALAIFLVVSLCRPNASINLQGKQSLSRLPWDDALVYVTDGSGAGEYREVIRDHADLIPTDAPEKLHFNLWLTDTFVLAE